MNKKVITAVAVCTAVLLALIGWRFSKILMGGKSGSASGMSRGGRRGGGGPMPVGTAKVGKKVMQFPIDQVGSVESSQNVEIVAKAAGPVIEVLFRQGDAVTSGQVLAKIDPSQAQANLLKAESSLASARFTYYQLLSQQELTGVQAESGVSIAQADLRAAQAGLDKSSAVYAATVTQGRTSVAQAQSNLVGAQAQLRQAEVDFATSKSKYERMLGLQRQGFASNADLQDYYRDVLAKDAAVDQQRANVKVAQNEVVNAQAQARKDSTSARADIQTSKFNQASKAASLAEAQAGTSKTAAFAQQLRAQEALVRASQADQQAAQLNLDNTIMRSPVDGFVSDRKLDVGALASVGTPILTVQSGAEVWVVTPLPQEAYGRVSKGHPCQVTIDGIRNQVFPGKVFTKDAAIDSASRQFNIRVKIEDPKHQVKPGMFARVKINLGRPDPRLVVSNSALTDKDQEKHTATVYRVVDGKAVKTEVKTGRSDSQDTIVSGGLNEGDEVIVQSAAGLKDGQAVNVSKATPTPSASPRPERL